MIIAIVLMMLAGRNSEQGKLAFNYDYQDILHRRIKNIEKECVSFSYWNTICIRNSFATCINHTYMFASSYRDKTP